MVGILITIGDITDISAIYKDMSISKTCDFASTTPHHRRRRCRELVQKITVLRPVRIIGIFGFKSNTASNSPSLYDN